MASGEWRVASGEWRVRNYVHLIYSLFAIRYSLFAIRRFLVHLLHEHPDGAAAGQADFPGGLVGDAEFQHFRLAAVDHVERLGDDGPFDAAAGHRAEEIALVVDD